ncbi:hypothetical protein EDD85DRAFT_809653 [Armillaria nabsnona]|nr:hypothetical protein EDD85DRAFT_809653 [Armillaria nabsnona]
MMIAWGIATVCVALILLLISAALVVYWATRRRRSGASAPSHRFVPGRERRTGFYEQNTLHITGAAAGKEQKPSYCSGTLPV